MGEDYGRQIVYIQDGGVGERYMRLGTVTDLAEEMRVREHTDYEINEVYGLDQMGELKELTWQVRGAEWFGDDWSCPEVVVTFPDGGQEAATYRVDGRA